MDIGRTEGVQGPGNVQGPRKIPNVGATPPASAPQDRVEISEAARLISEISSLPKVRQERIDAVRRLIETGQFDTPERLSGALERFLEENPDVTP
jgi:hypothetical protein